MTKYVFQGIGAVMTAPTGTFDEDHRTYTGWVRPVAASSGSHAGGYPPFPLDAGGGVTAISDFQYHIDFRQRVRPASNPATAQIDGWGVNPDGTEVAEPVTKRPGGRDDGESRLRHTTIGGGWPHDRNTGMIYLASRYYAENSRPIANALGWPFAGSEPAVYLTTAYDAAGAYHRYVGFLARKVSKADPSSNVLVRFYTRSSRPVEIEFDFELNIDDPEQVDKTPVEYIAVDSRNTVTRASITPLKSGSEPDGPCVIFLNARHVYRLQLQNTAKALELLTIPKLPFWLDL